MNHERGQAITEYAVLIAFGMAVFLAPVFGGQSVFGLLIEVFDIYLNSFHFVLKLPVP